MKDIAGVLIPRGNHLNIVRRKNIGWLCLNTQCASTCVGCLPKLDAKDDVWAWDFVFDRTTAGSPIKWLSIVDEHTRECLALKADRGIGAEDVDRYAGGAIRDARRAASHP